MNILANHYLELKHLIEPLDTPERRQQYVNREVPRAAFVVDWDKRYRWDLYSLGASSHMTRTLYDYLNDSHIDTALRKIVPPLPVPKADRRRK